MRTERTLNTEHSLTSLHAPSADLLEAAINTCKTEDNVTAVVVTLSPDLIVQHCKSPPRRPRMFFKSKSQPVTPGQSTAASNASVFRAFSSEGQLQSTPDNTKELDKGGGARDDTGSGRLSLNVDV